MLNQYIEKGNELIRQQISNEMSFYEYNFSWLTYTLHVTRKKNCFNHLKELYLLAAMSLKLLKL